MAAVLLVVCGSVNAEGDGDTSGVGFRTVGGVGSACMGWFTSLIFMSLSSSLLHSVSSVGLSGAGGGIWTRSFTTISYIFPRASLYRFAIHPTSDSGRLISLSSLYMC